MKVSIVKCGSYEQKRVDMAVSEALKLIDFKIKEGCKILLKPNLAGPYNPKKAVTTHPSILIALCHILKKKNAKVYIGDSPGNPDRKKVWEVSGINDVVKKCKLNFIDFDSSKLITLENKKNKILKKLELPDIVKKVDLVINLPKLKTHVFTKYTGAIKNLYGFIPGDKKMYYHLITKTDEKFAEMLLDVHEFIKPQLTIMDAIIGMEGNGPNSGIPKKTGLVLSSKDTISLDIVASEIIGYKTKDIPMITEAKKRGLNPRIEKIGLSNIRVNYKKPFSLKHTIFPKFIKEIMFKPILSIDNEKCQKCMICYKKCPAKAITFKGNVLKINSKKCIMCYCCYELCSVQAIKIKVRPILIYGRKLLKFLNINMN